VRELKLSTPKGRPHSRANKCAEACSEIPYSTEQGILRRNREFVRENRELNQEYSA
jgi:hypothetical protein